MTTRIEYSAFVSVDYPEEQIDQLGYAQLRNKARDLGLVLVGEVVRVSDELVIGVAATQEDGTEGITYVEIGHPLANGRTNPDARRIRWEIDAEPAPTAKSVLVVAQVHGDQRLARADVPSEVTESGGLVEFRHDLGGDCVVRAYRGDEESGYSYATPIDDNRTEILLPPGVTRLEAIRDDPPEDKQ